MKTTLKFLLSGSIALLLIGGSILLRGQMTRKREERELRKYVSRIQPFLARVRQAAIGLSLSPEERKNLLTEISREKAKCTRFSGNRAIANCLAAFDRAGEILTRQTEEETAFAEGVKLQKSGDLAAAAEKFRKAAASGSPAALNALGAVLCKQNRQDEAKTCFEKAAAQNFAPAQCNLGLLCYDDDPSRAFVCFTGAAKTVPVCARYCGAMQAKGIGTKNNLAKAVQNLRSALERGDAGAAPLLAILLTKDPATAAEGLRMLAELAPGNPGLCELCARLAASGTGMPKDRKLAEKYLKMAQLSGNPRAGKLLKKLHDWDDDGLPDEFELRFGLNPDDPADAAQDSDGDGFSNLVEFRAKTSPVDGKFHPPLWLRLAPVGATMQKFELRLLRVTAKEARLGTASGKLLLWGKGVKIRINHQEYVLAEIHPTSTHQGGKTPARIVFSGAGPGKKITIALADRFTAELPVIQLQDRKDGKIHLVPIGGYLPFSRERVKSFPPSGKTLRLLTPTGKTVTLPLKQDRPAARESDNVSTASQSMEL